jgi:CRP-like cAMP-binding protein
MDSFWGNVFKGEVQEETHELLKRIPIFEKLDRRELIAIEHIMHRRQYAADEVVFRQGEPGVGMYVVQSGQVSISYEPKGQVLAELSDGDFFGEVALLNETPRSATAQARTTCTLWGLSRPDLLDLLVRNPRLGVRLLLPLAQITGQRLIRADEQIHALREALARHTQKG